MKKQLIFAAAALALAACSNDENLNLNDGPVEIRLSSGIEVKTRAATDIQGSAFDANELVDVYITEAVQSGRPATTIYPQPLVYLTGAGNTMSPRNTTEQPYFPTSGNGVTIYAVYPSAAETFPAEGSGFGDGTFTIQADQSTDKNYKLSDLMYGTANDRAEVKRTSSSVPINFGHLLSKVTVNLTAGSGLVDANLNNATVSLLGLQLTTGFTTETGVLGTVSGETAEITVMNATSTSLSGSAVIVPQSLAIHTPFIKIHLAEGGDLYYNLAEAATFQSGMVYIYNITVNLTGLTVTSNIEPWDTEGEGGYTGDDDGSATMQ